MSKQPIGPDRGVCPDCGGQLPPDAPEGLCPRCVLAGVMGSQDDVEPHGNSPVSPPIHGRFVAPSPVALAKDFPQLEIVELLGQGGMGMVYKARQPALDRMVALKILPPEISDDPAFAERFVREARMLAKLNHPNIITIYDFGQVNGRCYFVMEYVDGVNLRQSIQAGKLSAQEALGIISQICTALQFAHDEGIVHRDIKPENVLLDKKGRAKIADFGLAKLLGRTRTRSNLTGSQVVMGTPHYMAPEQAEHPQQVDHRADIYSLGVVFYELLTGGLPLGRFSPPSNLVRVDVRLDGVVLRALEKDPERRYQHVSEVGADVLSIAGKGPPLLARLAACFQQLRKWRPGPRWVLLLTASALLLTATIVIPAFLAQRGRPEKEASSGTKPERQAVSQAQRADQGGPIKEVAHEAFEGSVQVEIRDQADELKVQVDDRVLEAAQLGKPIAFSEGEHRLKITGDYFDPLDQKFSVSRGSNPPLTPIFTQKVGLLHLFQGHTAPVWCVAFSPDGRQILSGGGGTLEVKSDQETVRLENADTTMRLWDVATGRELRQFPGHSAPVISLAFQPANGTILSASTDKSIRLWDGETAAETRRFDNLVLTCATFSHDGLQAVSGRDFSAYQWDLATGQEIRRFEGHENILMCMAISPDGKQLITASFDGTVRLWDTKDPTRNRPLGDRAPPSAAAFSPDNRLAATTGTNHVLRLWDVQNGIQLQGLAGHSKIVTCVAFSPDSKRLLSGSLDATIRLWDVESGSELCRFEGHTATVRGIAFSPNGRRAVSGSYDTTVRLWGLPMSRDQATNTEEL